MPHQIKHRLLIRLFFNTGMRVSEIVRLKVCDLEFERKIGYVRMGKGNKDRMFLLTENMIREIKEYLADRTKNSAYVFECKENHLSIRAAQAVIKNSSKRIRLTKNISPHTFRRSFATYLLEKGIDSESVRRLMGHRDGRTTKGYYKNARMDYKNVDSVLEEK